MNPNPPLKQPRSDHKIRQIYVHEFMGYFLIHVYSIILPYLGLLPSKVTYTAVIIPLRTYLILCQLLA